MILPNNITEKVFLTKGKSILFTMKDKESGIQIKRKSIDPKYCVSVQINGSHCRNHERRKSSMRVIDAVKLTILSKKALGLLIDLGKI
jgi:hypothetical protein